MGSGGSVLQEKSVQGRVRPAGPCGVDGGGRRRPRLLSAPLCCGEQELRRSPGRARGGGALRPRRAQEGL